MGIYPEVSLRLARERRDEAGKLLARDSHPSAYRKARERSQRQEARNSLEAVATEWLTKHSPNWSTGWVRRLERELEREAFPYIGASPVAEITAPDLLAVVRRVEARGHLRKTHTVFQVCGRVLRYAVPTGRVERDVSADLREALPPVKTKHFAAITDPREVGPLLRQLDTYSGTLSVPRTADEPGHALERVPGAGHPEEADDDARVPSDGAHDSGRGAGVPARLHRAPVGARHQGSQRQGLQPDGVPARTARDAAGLGQLSGPAPGRGDRARDPEPFTVIQRQPGVCGS